MIGPGQVGLLPMIWLSEHRMSLLSPDLMAMKCGSKDLDLLQTHHRLSRAVFILPNIAVALKLHLLPELGGWPISQV